MYSWLSTAVRLEQSVWRQLALQFVLAYATAGDGVATLGPQTIVAVRYLVIPRHGSRSFESPKVARETNTIAEGRPSTWATTCDLYMDWAAGVP